MLSGRGAAETKSRRDQWCSRNGNDGTRLTERPLRIGIDSQGNAETFLSKARKRFSVGNRVEGREDSSSARADRRSMPICHPSALV